MRSQPRAPESPLGQAIEAALAIGALVPAALRLVDVALLASGALWMNAHHALPPPARQAAVFVWGAAVVAAAACALAALRKRAKFAEAAPRARAVARITLPPVEPSSIAAMPFSVAALVAGAPLAAEALAPGAFPGALLARAGEIFAGLAGLGLALRYSLPDASARP